MHALKGRKQSLEHIRKRVENRRKNCKSGWYKIPLEELSNIIREATVRTQFKKGHQGYWRGKNLSEKHRNNISETNKKVSHTPEWNKKESIALTGKPHPQSPHFSVRGELSPNKRPEKREKSKQSIEIAFNRILQEIPELEKQGFRCIPIGKVIPDIIAIKIENGKLFIAGVEVEYGKPNTSKYTPEIRRYFDDIYWIIRK